MTTVFIDTHDCCVCGADLPAPKSGKVECPKCTAKYKVEVIDSYCEFLSIEFDDLALMRSCEKRFQTDLTAAYFEIEKKKWLEETKLLSSMSKITKHPSYQNIIKLGKKAIPLILKDLRKETNHWFFALHKITGQDPIKKEHEGYVLDMANDWIEWGIKNSFIERSSS